MKTNLQATWPNEMPCVRRRRTSRRSLSQIPDVGPYRLPRSAQETLLARIVGIRNAESVFLLATFLARFHATPGRIGSPFCIDRRALAGHEKLDLSEARVRGAMRVLIEVGFIVPVVATGSAYHPTEHGLRRKAGQFVFGAAFLMIFRKAVAQKVTQTGQKRRPLISPKEIENKKKIYLGEIGKPISPVRIPIPDERLERALSALRSSVLGAEPSREPATTW